MAYQLGGQGRSGQAEKRPQVADRQFGTVKWFSAEKVFGFILPDKGDGDVFLHIGAIKKSGLETLAEGQRVRYELGTPKAGKSPPAVNIQMA